MRLFGLERRLLRDQCLCVDSYLSAMTAPVGNVSSIEHSNTAAATCKDNNQATGGKEVAGVERN